MKETSIAYDISALQDAEGLIYDEFDRKDDQLLDEMRALVKKFVLDCVQNAIKDNEKEQCRTIFNELRAKLHDDLLREYSSFEFMEKLYTQEYSAE